MDKKKILIVEDQGIIALSIKNKLENHGYDVIGIIDKGDNVVLELQKHIPDLILMDINLKDKTSGIEAAIEARKKFDIPSIFLTAYADDVTLEAAVIAEPVGYLTKPFEAEVLLKRIPNIKFIYLKEEDIVRNALVKAILRAYDKKHAKSNRRSEQQSESPGM